MTVRSRFGLVGSVLLLGLLASVAAGAESTEGVAIVLEKDVANGTMLIEPPIITLHVTKDTKITGLDGETIEFSALPTATKLDAGGYEVSGDLTIEYEASHDGDKLVVHRIQRKKGVLQ